MICAKRVFRCFKTVERWGNKITGAAGPYFVGLAVLLIGTGTFAFFDVIAPSLSYPIVSIPICLLIAVNLWAHYYYVITIQPGFIEDPPKEAQDNLLWARRTRSLPKGGVRWTNAPRVTQSSLSRCNRCAKMRPERAHHCRICNRCVLKYDHHCPVRINQCVGLYNERHFVLFMAYLVVATFCFGVSGYGKILEALGINTYSIHWPHYTPEVVFAMVYVLAVVLCFAVGIMLAWHLWGVSNGETSVEAQDHEQYSSRAKARDEVFVNSYDLGRKRNFILFFNIGDGGYPWYTLLLPLRILPYTDGRSWARREGLDRHQGLRAGEELTDESDDEGYEE